MEGILDTRMRFGVEMMKKMGGGDSNQSGSSVTLDTSATIESDLCSNNTVPQGTSSC